MIILHFHLQPQFKYELFHINFTSIFREQATSALAGFHAGPLSWSKRNLEMIVFVEEGKPENPEKNL